MQMQGQALVQVLMQMLCAHLVEPQLTYMRQNLVTLKQMLLLPI